MEPIDGQYAPQPGPQEMFLSSPADIVIYGGAAGGGKSACLLMEPLRNAMTPGFGALILRRTHTELMGTGGLWEESATIYPHFAGKQKIGDMTWRFPAGASIKFSGIEHETDKLKYQGREFALIEFDELTHFSESQFWYLVSRNRSTCGVKPYIRASCNPDADSWVAELIAWWIDQSTGYPIPERSGVLRWYLRVDGELKWADDPQELRDRYPQMAAPRSLTFIAAKLSDNKILTTKDPDYLAKLQSLPYVERERLLGGNWKVRSSAGSEWPAEYFDEIWADHWPSSFELSAMAIDPSKGREFGDFGAIVFGGITGGAIWVDAIVARMPAPQIAEATVDLFYSHSPMIVGLESNMNQDTALVPMMDRVCELRGVPPLPIHPFMHTAADNKLRRIFRLGPYIKNKQIKLRRDSPGCKILESQLRGFPLPDVHDDGPDALEMTVRLLNMLATELEARKHSKDREQLILT